MRKGESAASVSPVCVCVFWWAVGLLHISSVLDVLPLPPPLPTPPQPSCASQREMKQNSQDRETQTGLSPRFNAITGMSASGAKTAINIPSSRHRRLRCIDQELPDSSVSWVLTLVCPPV